MRNKPINRSILVVAVISIVPQLVFSGQVTNPALRSAIIEELGLPPDHDLTADDLSELTHLRARSAGIADLSGLEAAGNLQELDLRDNDIRDISPLAGLTDLRWLSLRENPQLRDVTALAGLSELEYLNLNYSYGIQSIRPISGLANLAVLLMRGVRILDQDDEAALLAQLSGLERLNVRDTGLESVEVLLPGLHAGDYQVQLDLEENPIRDAALLRPYREELNIASVGPVFSGRLRAGTALQYGYYEWPGSDAAAGLGWAELVAGELMYDMDARFAVDYRPSAAVRAYAQVATGFDADRMEFELPKFRRLFAQYRVFSSSGNSELRFRGGLQSMEWGHTLFHVNAADLVQNVDDGIALRTDADFRLPDSLPVIGGTDHELTGLIDAQRGFFDNNKNPGLHEFAYALRYRFGTRQWRIGGAVRMQRDAQFPVQTVGKLRLRPGRTVSALTGLELHAQAAAYWLTDDLPKGDGFYTVTVEYDMPASGWEMLAEYQYDSTHISGHFAASRVSAPPIPGVGIVPSLEWRHAAHDNSGVWLPRLQRRLTAQLNAELSIPIVYGDPNSYYRRWDERLSYLELPQSTPPLPAAVTLSLQFEIGW